ncbi:MAG: MFS transporter [Alphaproteobacteria bacterium]|nr:MFS transporter [Alphaproteobacteria bacterium]MBU1512827.1 MFS transporter [Alphaproteobacteria bacterium]MBU2095737.1 MFS transporter [Alphaproteobacteria bacterium]MBU2153193.1 MFS transporter [Alphaproteobacteria bacterium]MBU2308995.1 MFS transporter [Alphaproteobacteria bacterium]
MTATASSAQGAAAPAAEGKPARLGLSTKLFYGVGTVAFGVKDQGFSSLLLIFYNQVIGMPAATVGAAIMVALIVDSLLDPIMGQVSDNWRSRWGRRHPFMYAAAVPAALSYLLLWNPPALSPGMMFAYLVAVAIVIRSFITMYEIPSSALAPELTQDYHERTQVFAIRQFFGWVGGVGMTVLALQVFLTPDAEHPVGQLNRDGYQAYALCAAVVMLVAILVSTIGTHRHIPRLRTPPVRKIGLGQLVGEMTATLAHRSFLVLIAAGLFNAMAQGLVLSLTLYMGTYLWQLSSGQIAILTASNFIAAMIALVMAPSISRRLGKREAARLMKITSLVFAVSPIGLRLAGVLPANGDPMLLPILVFAGTIATATTITTAILISSMIADVVEDSELRTGRRSEGLFFSVSAFVAKAVSGVGIFISSAILALIAFPKGAKPGQVAPDVIDSLGLTYICVVAALYAGAILAISLYRITREDHDANVRKLAEQG